MILILLITIITALIFIGVCIGLWRLLFLTRRVSLLRDEIKAVQWFLEQPVIEKIDALNRDFNSIMTILAYIKSRIRMSSPPKAFLENKNQKIVIDPETSVKLVVPVNKQKSRRKR